MMISGDIVTSTHTHKHAQSSTHGQWLRAMMQYIHTQTHTTSTIIYLVTGQLNIAAKTLVIVLVARVHSHDTYLPVVQAQSRYLSRPEFFPSGRFFSENKAKL